MLSRRRLLQVLAAPLLAPLTAGCGGAVPQQPLRLLVPNAPGGGYDTTARLLASAIADVGDEAAVDVFNLPGASGMAGIARLQRELGSGSLLMMMGLGVVGAAAVAGRPGEVTANTPIARLLSEPELVMVGSESRYARFDELARAWTRDPGAVLVGGGSLPGGPDHLATFALADELGVATAQVRYRTYDGGGPLLAALLERQVDVVVSGVLESIDQVRSGAVRGLAVTGPRRLPGLPTPTLRELGLDAELENWRGLLAPPAISESTRERLVGLVERATRTRLWDDAVDDYGWTPAWLAGDDFADFLAEEQRRTTSLLERLGGTRDG